MKPGDRVRWVNRKHSDEQCEGVVLGVYESTPLHPDGGQIAVEWDDGEVDDEVLPDDIELVE